MRLRSINRPYFARARERYYRSDGTIFHDSSAYPTLPEVRVDTSDDKHWFPRRPRDLNRFWGDWGGEFTSLSTRFFYDKNRTLYKKAEGFEPAVRYDGYWVPENLYGMVSPLTPPSSSTLDAWGTKGVALALPTRPQAGLTQFVGELKDLPRKPIVGLYRAIKSGARRKDLFRGFGKGIGGEYLNYEFGWRPFIQDMLDFHEAARDAMKHIDQLERNSGRMIRRRRTIYENQDTYNYGPKESIGSGPSVNNLILKGSKLVSEVTDEQKIWFSGAFTYFLSAGPDYVSQFKRNEQILNYLFGTRIGLDTIWELSPWSWALDWVSSIGSVATNLAAFSNDGLVMRYGYVMFNRKITRTSVLSCTQKGTLSTVQTAAVCAQELKMRRRATPFGFGLTVGSFSERQLAILAALKLTKIR